MQRWDTYVWTMQGWNIEEMVHYTHTHTHTHIHTHTRTHTHTHTQFLLKQKEERRVTRSSSSSNKDFSLEQIPWTKNVSQLGWHTPLWHTLGWSLNIGAVKTWNNSPSSYFLIESMSCEWPWHDFFQVRPSNFAVYSRSDMAWVHSTWHSCKPALRAAHEVILLHPSRIWFLKIALLGKLNPGPCPLCP